MYAANRFFIPIQGIPSIPQLFSYESKAATYNFLLSTVYDQTNTAVSDGK